MARHLRDATPKYALVVWPDEPDQERPTCIALDGLPEAITYGAMVIAREDGEFCCPRSRVLPHPGMVERTSRHPYRSSAKWRNAFDDDDTVEDAHDDA